MRNGSDITNDMYFVFSKFIFENNTVYAMPRKNNVDRVRPPMAIRGVSSKFGEWYQKTNKLEYTNKTNFIDLHYNRHPSKHAVGNVNKASGNCKQRPCKAAGT
jgi:hypothetical protein